MKQSLGFPQSEALYSGSRRIRGENMANLEQSCMVLDLALALKANGSWAGETHIQKAGYFLNKLLKVPTISNSFFTSMGPFRST